MQCGQYVFAYEGKGRKRKCLGSGKIAEVKGGKALVVNLPMSSAILGRMPDFDGRWIDVKNLEAHPAAEW